MSTIYPIADDAKFQVVGKWTGRRLDAQAKITGQMKFGADANFPDMLYMAIKHSTIPSGTITSMDTTAAKAIPGVVAILTPDDIKNNPKWGLKSDGTLAINWKSVPILPFDKIRNAGEEIAAVVAEDPYVAEEACQAIKVTYSPSPFVLHPLTAKSSSAPQVYTGTANQAAPTTYTVGDATTAMKDTSLTIFNGTYESSHWQNNNIEPWAFTVKVDNTGRTEMWSSNAYAKTFQYSIAGYLGVARSRVRVYNECGSASFGDKTGTNRSHILGCLLAQMTGRPVHFLATHEHNLIIGNHRNKVVFQIQIGYTSAGVIKALIGTLYGCNSAFGGGGTSGSALGLYAVYKFPNFLINTYDVYSNTNNCGPIRCVADPYAMWCINSALDEIAMKLGMSLSDLIAANDNQTYPKFLYVSGDKDQQTTNRIASCGQPDMYTQALSMSGFTEDHDRPAYLCPRPVHEDLLNIRFHQVSDLCLPDRRANDHRNRSLHRSELDDSARLQHLCCRSRCRHGHGHHKGHELHSGAGLWQGALQGWIGGTGSERSCSGDKRSDTGGAMA